jgi:hypothetical protein
MDAVNPARRGEREYSVKAKAQARGGMDLLWKPVVRSRSVVEIPEVTIHFDASALKRWEAAYDPWIQSNRKRYSVFREYAELARSGRFLLPYANEPRTRRFAELHTALLLQREGFFCWGGVHLFEYGRAFVKGKGNTKANTEDVRSRVPWSAPCWWPNDIQETLKFQPRNPDIVAYSEELNEWRFCEVKGPNDRVKEDQWKALAVLHLLTGAPVAVVHVVENHSPITSGTRSTEIEYRKGAHFDWICRRLRKRCLTD